jgi:hypothetical protein
VFIKKSIDTHQYILLCTIFDFKYKQKSKYFWLKYKPKIFRFLLIFKIGSIIYLATIYSMNFISRKIMYIYIYIYMHRTRYSWWWAFKKVAMCYFFFYCNVLVENHIKCHHVFNFPPFKFCTLHDIHFGLINM